MKNNRTLFSIILSVAVVAGFGLGMFLLLSSGKSEYVPFLVIGLVAVAFIANLAFAAVNIVRSLRRQKRDAENALVAYAESNAANNVNAKNDSTGCSERSENHDESAMLERADNAVNMVHTTDDNAENDSTGCSEHAENHDESALHVRADNAVNIIHADGDNAKIDSTGCSERSENHDESAAEEKHRRELNEAFAKIDRRNKVLSIIFVAYELAALAATIAFGLAENVIGVFVGMGCFAVPIVAFVIASSVRQRRALRPIRCGAGGLRAADATVLRCSVASTSTFSVGGRNKYSSVIYKVTLDFHGEKRVTFSRDFYSAGSKVTVEYAAENDKKIRIITE